jgi:multiple sugar transport system substrate-binding protein
MKHSIRLFFLFFACQLVIGCQALPAQQSTLIAQRTATALGQPTATGTPVPVEPQLEVTPSALRGVQIVFWYPWTGAAAATMTTMIDEFNQTNSWGIFVIGRNFPGEEAEFNAFNSVTENSDLPDLVAAPLSEVLYWQQGGVPFLDLSSYLRSSTWGYSETELQGQYPAVWQQYLIDGFLWGVPAYQTLHLLFYNQSWAATLGFNSPPVTLEEFRNQACTAAITNNTDSDPENDGTGGWIINDQPETIISWLMAFDQTFTHEISTADRFTTDGAVSTFTYLHDLSADGCAWNALEPTPDDYMTNHYALFYSSTLEDVLAQEYSLQWFGTSDRWTIMPYQGTNEEVTLLSGDLYAILVNSINKQMAAWLFTKWLNEPENHQRLVKVSGSLPLTEEEAGLLASFGSDHPNWLRGLSYIGHAQYMPRTSAWTVEKMVLPDALWQSLQANMMDADILSILARADAMITELLSHDQ